MQEDNTDQTFVNETQQKKDKEEACVSLCKQF